MNSQDYRNLQEAYIGVYDYDIREKLEFESWVNNLLEEGYDLSDYTWEEMYENYLNEYAAGRVPGSAGAVTMYSRPVANTGSSYQSRFASSGPPTAIKTRSGTQSGQVSNLGNNYRGQELQQAARANASQVKPTSPVAKPAPRQQAPARPAATPRPSAGAPTRPSAATPAASRPSATPTATSPKTTPTTPTKPAIGTTQGGTKFERRTPTSAELSAAQASRASGGSQEDAIKAGVGASKPTPPTPAAAPTPSGESDRLKKALDIKKSDVTSGFDMFDTVKGYLIGEGYADTEEAALAIMANMSEDWKYSIIEQQISSVSASAPSGVKKPAVTASISAGGKTPPGQKMLDKAGQMLSGKGPSNNFGRGF